MPSAPSHPCANPACGALAPRGSRYCPACAQRFEAKRHRDDLQRRGSAASRGYDGDHRAWRQQVLERDFYLCRYCANVGLDTQARIADHVLPVRLGGERLDLDNGAACCDDCHREKSLKHDGWWGREPNPIRRVEDFRPSWPAERGLVAA